MKYGYARVSTSDQDLEIQKNALLSAGCEVVREEKVSGTSLKGRSELATLLEFLRKLLNFVPTGAGGRFWLALWRFGKCAESLVEVPKI